MEGRPLGPIDSYDSGFRTLDRQTDPDMALRGVVQVLPGVFPQRSLVLPPVALACDGKLERFGEARLARAIASADDGDAGSRMQFQL